MIREKSIAIWGKGREFPFLSKEEKDLCFEELKSGCASTFIDERQWAIEAMYRLLWDFSSDQRIEAIEQLVIAVGDSDPKCAEYAVKGLQYSLEFVDQNVAREIAFRLVQSINESSAEILQVVAIEVLYSLFTAFSSQKKLALTLIESLFYFETVNREWLHRTVPSLERLRSLLESLTSGINLEQIGIVRNGYSTLEAMSDFDVNSISYLHIWSCFEQDFEGLSSLQHVVVVCYLDDQGGVRQGSSSMASKHRANFGQFATSNPIRRNPVFYKTGLLLGVEGNVIRVQGIRVLDMTPIIDVRAPNIHDVNGLALCRGGE